MMKKKVVCIAVGLVFMSGSVMVSVFVLMFIEYLVLLSLGVCLCIVILCSGCCALIQYVIRVV